LLVIWGDKSIDKRSLGEYHVPHSGGSPVNFVIRKLLFDIQY
jgi:hypothetical protein